MFVIKKSGNVTAKEVETVFEMTGCNEGHRDLRSGTRWSRSSLTHDDTRPPSPPCIKEFLFTNIPANYSLPVLVMDSEPID